MGVRHPRQEVNSLGGRPLQGSHDLQGGLSVDPAKGQVRAATLPPKRLPIGHRLSQSPRRG